MAIPVVPQVLVRLGATATGRRVGGAAIRGASKAWPTARRAGRWAWPSKDAPLWTRTWRKGAVLAGGATVFGGDIPTRIVRAAIGMDPEEAIRPTDLDDIDWQDPEEAGRASAEIIARHREGEELVIPEGASAAASSNPEVQMAVDIVSGEQSLEDLQEQIASQLGVDAGVGGNVVVGYGPPEFGTGPVDEPGTLEFFGDPQMGMNVEQTQSIEVTMREIQNMEEQELHELQAKMFVAGFYGGAGFEDIRWGFPAPETLAAAERMLGFAAQHQRQGQRTPWWEALDDLVAASGGMDEFEQFEEGTPVLAQLSDPQALAQTVDTVFQNVAGRGANSEEKQAFIALLHRMQREQQQSLQTMRFGDVTGVDVGAQAEAFARTEDPEGFMGTEARRVGRAFGGTP